MYYEHIGFDAPKRANISHSNDTNDIEFCWSYLLWIVLFIYTVTEIEFFYIKKNLNDQNYHTNTQEFEVMNPTIAKKNNGGRFAFMIGSLTVVDPVSDEEFGVHTDQPYLQRIVECYSWKESVRQVNHVNEITYKTCWQPVEQMSSNFKNSKYVTAKPAYSGKVICAQYMTLGVYRVDVLSFAN